MAEAISAERPGMGWFSQRAIDSQWHKSSSLRTAGGKEKHHGSLKINSNRGKECFTCVLMSDVTPSFAAGLFVLTWTLVKFASLGDVPFAQPGPLANGWPDAVHIVAGQNSVQKNPSALKKHKEQKKETRLE